MTDESLFQLVGNKNRTHNNRHYSVVYLILQAVFWTGEGGGIEEK